MEEGNFEAGCLEREMFFEYRGFDDLEKNNKLEANSGRFYKNRFGNLCFVSNGSFRKVKHLLNNYDSDVYYNLRERNWIFADYIVKISFHLFVELGKMHNKINGIKIKPESTGTVDGSFFSCFDLLPTCSKRLFDSAFEYKMEDGTIDKKMLCFLKNKIYVLKGW